MATKLSRRQFLGTAAGAGLAAPWLTTTRVAAAPGRPAPSDVVRIGHIGLGGMGSGHLGDYCQNDEFTSVALCDVHETARVNAARRCKHKVALYSDFRELLDRPDVDAVFIATPDHWHALATILAAQAGKDVYCEKPLSLTVEEGRAMVSAVRRCGRVLQTGSQQRSSDNFRQAVELVRSGRIGRLHTVHVNIWGTSRECHFPARPVPEGMDWDLWLGPAPWRPFHPALHPASWRAFRDYSGGSNTDWGAHHVDIAQWGIGASHGGPIRIDPPSKEHRGARFTYANGVVCTMGAHVNGVRFDGTEGKIEVNRGYWRTWPESVWHKPLGPGDVQLHRTPGNSVAGHRRNFEACLRSRELPICDVEIGHRSITACHLANIACWLDRTVHWDPEKEQVLNDPEAARCLSRPMRPPWRLT